MAGQMVYIVISETQLKEFVISPLVSNYLKISILVKEHNVKVISYVMPYNKQLYPTINKTFLHTLIFIKQCKKNIKS